MPRENGARAKEESWRYKRAAAASSGRWRPAPTSAAAPSGGDSQPTTNVWGRYCWPIVIPPLAREDRDYDCALSLLDLGRRLQGDQRVNTSDPYSTGPGPAVLVQASDVLDEPHGTDRSLEAILASKRHWRNAVLMFSLMDANVVCRPEPKDWEKVWCKRRDHRIILEKKLRDSEAEVNELEEQHASKRRHWLDADAAFLENLRASGDKRMSGPA